MENFIIFNVYMFISIGAACDVKYNIDKCTGSKHTLFFDWLMVDMASVNKIIGANNIDDILFFENIIQDPKHEKARILIKSLSYCVSLHDGPVNNSGHVNNYIQKYKRRYSRIIETILNDNSVIYFIRFGKITNYEKNIFINNIQNINSNCKFKLVEITAQNETNDYFITEEYFISVNIDNYRIKAVRNSWTSDCWNWKELFSDISKT